jgi:hypothetical protein
MVSACGGDQAPAPTGCIRPPSPGPSSSLLFPDWITAKMTTASVQVIEITLLRGNGLEAAKEKSVKMHCIQFIHLRRFSQKWSTPKGP